MTSNLTIGGGGGGNSGVSDDGSKAHYNDLLENFSGGGVGEIEEDFSIDISSNRQMNNLDPIKEETEGSLFSFDFHGGGGGVGEIEEDFSIDISSNRQMNNLDPIKEETEGSLFSFDFHGGGGDDSVYVAVWKQNEEASMDALIWAMKNTVISSSTVVFLVHVFPETKFIPSPLGKLSVSQVNPEQKENYMAQERGKRREFLQKFLNVRPTSESHVRMDEFDLETDLARPVKVDTILIESDMEAKAILDLIPILYIKKLVLGATKSNIRKIKSGRGNGVIDQILHNAPEFCDVKIICEGKEMAELMVESSPSSPSPSPRSIGASPKLAQDQRKTENDLFGCGCFKVKE